MAHNARHGNTKRPRGIECCEGRLCLALVMDVHPVTASESNNPGSAFAADLDGDGDLDGLSASTGDGKIAWYQNLDGKGRFGSQTVITRFAPLPTYSLAPQAAVFAGDLDHDGDQDVVWSASGGLNAPGQLAWHENLDGSGTFGGAKSLGSAHTWSIHLADLNADGFDDLVLGNGWMRNTTGRAQFSALMKFPAPDGSEGYASRATDLDGDGDLDIAVTSHISIAWLENTDGRGTFQHAQRLNSANGALDIATGDIDGDGDFDIISSSFYHSLAWYENVGGSPRFAAWQPMNSRAWTLQTGDVDRDGDVDVIANWGWWENTDGRGTWRFNRLETTIEPTLTYPADIDADGDLDLLVVDARQDKVSWFENSDGRGAFVHRASLATTGLAEAKSVQVADLDGDGDTDLLAAGYRTLVWYENQDGAGSYAPPRSISTEDSAPQAVDIDGDGDLDIVSQCYCDASLSWFENLDGRGNFGPARRVANEYGQMALEIADFSPGLGPDLISIFDPSDFRAPTVVQLRRNLGNKTFSSPVTLATLPSYSFLTYRLLEATDIDQDADLDLLVNTSSGTLTLFRNDGTGKLDPPTTFAFTQEDAMALVDIDADGDSDLLLANSTTNAILWRENVDGRGQFGTSKTAATNIKSPLSPQLADLDGDGDKDLSVLLAESGEAVWFENLDGSGLFGSKQIIPTSRVLLSYVAADLDRDGDVDFALASQRDDSIDWLENLQIDGGPLVGDANQDGLFNSADLIAIFQAGEYEDAIEDNSTFAEGDWNGDGDFDSADLVLAFQAGMYVTQSKPKT